MTDTSIRIQALSVFSTQGMRPAQEDYVIANQDKGIFAIADGFGGPGPGSSASRAACDGIKGFLMKEAGDLEATLPFVLRSYFSLAGNVLFNSLIHANRVLMAQNRDKSILERGGSSVLAGFIDGDLLALANAGLCTAWLFRSGEETELVRPRSYGNLCDPFARELAEEYRVPLIALGTSEDVEPEIFEYRIRPGDWLLMHTDGLTSVARKQLLSLHQGAHATQDPKEWAERAASEANLLLGQWSFDDNTTVLLAIF